MTRTDLNIVLASILETLDESPDGQAPEGILSLAVGGNWDLISGILLRGKLVLSSGSCLIITNKGRDVAAQSRAFRAGCKVNSKGQGE